jgi:hypothetical protein
MLLDAASFEDHDLIRALDGSKSVGDDYGSTIRNQPVYGGIDQTLRGRVQA